MEMDSSSIISTAVCRLCAREDDENDLINLNPEDINQIQQCLSIELNENDLNSKYICFICKNNINFFYKFYEFCLKTNNKFKSILDAFTSNVSESDINPRAYIKEEEPVTIIEMGNMSDINDDRESPSNLKDPDNLISIIEHLEENNEIETYEMELGEIREMKDDMDIQFHFEENNENDNNVNDGIREYDEENNEKLTHRIHKRKGGLHVCEACDEICPNYPAYYAHIKTHGDKRFQCQQCLKWFKQRYCLREHLMIHTGNIPTCNDCGKQYVVRGNLSRHIRAVHENRSRYVCSKCGAVFTQSNALKTHLVVHERERTFECEFCAKRFKTQLYLSLHTSRVHDESEPAHVTLKEQRCKFCDRISDTLLEHKKHLLEHAAERPYSCDICEKRFRLENVYKAHLLVHTDQTPYKCIYCDKTFTDLALLNGHESTHIGKKKFFCDICGKVFLTIGHYNVHVRRHAGVKPYSCNLCEEKCFSRSLLRTHKLSKHKGIRKKGCQRSNGPVKLDYEILNQLDALDDDLVDSE